ncbi:TetR/AcrR family transcriptional regulator [Actinoplanes sp. CA-131856]
MTRSRQKPDETRHDILVAAGRQFARFGYSQVTLKDIAEEIGITAPLIVHYFGSKKELFRQVASSELGPMVPDFNGPLETLGRRLAEDAAAYWFELDYSFPALAMVRSLDVEEGRDLLAAEVERRTLPLAAVLPGPHALERARLVMSQFMGFGLFASGRLVDPDAPPPPPETLARAVESLAAALQVIITPPAPAPGS